MTSQDVKCGECKKSLPKHLRIIRCDKCEQFFHVKCCGITQKIFNSIKSSNSIWHCKHCELPIDVNCHLNAACITDNNSNSNNVKNSIKTVECGSCCKKLPNHLQIIHCGTCKNIFHVKCSGITQKAFRSIKDSNNEWHCKSCEKKPNVDKKPCKKVIAVKIFLNIYNALTVILVNNSFM